MPGLCGLNERVQVFDTGHLLHSNLSLGWSVPPPCNEELSLEESRNNLEVNRRQLCDNVVRCHIVLGQMHDV